MAILLWRLPGITRRALQTINTLRDQQPASVSLLPTTATSTNTPARKLIAAAKGKKPIYFYHPKKQISNPDRIQNILRNASVCCYKPRGQPYKGNTHGKYAKNHYTIPIIVIGYTFAGAHKFRLVRFHRCYHLLHIGIGWFVPGEMPDAMTQQMNTN